MSCYDSEDNRQRKKKVFELASTKRVERQNIAGAWPIHMKFPSFALIGPRIIEELDSSLKNLEVELTEEAKDPNPAPPPNQPIAPDEPRSRYLVDTKIEKPNRDMLSIQTLSMGR